MLIANLLFLYLLFFILKIFTCATILDYRSKFVNFKLSNETMKEVELGFENNTRILAYVDFINSIGDKS
jgi:hypothetical protein